MWIILRMVIEGDKGGEGRGMLMIILTDGSRGEGVLVDGEE